MLQEKPRNGLDSVLACEWSLVWAGDPPWLCKGMVSSGAVEWFNVGPLIPVVSFCHICTRSFLVCGSHFRKINFCFLTLFFNFTFLKYKIQLQKQYRFSVYLLPSGLIWVFYYISVSLSTHTQLHIFFCIIENKLQIMMPRLPLILQCVFPRRRGHFCPEPKYNHELGKLTLMQFYHITLRLHSDFASCLIRSFISPASKSDFHFVFMSL